MTNLKIECEEDFDVSPVEAAFSERLAGNARLAAELVFTDEEGIRSLNAKERGKEMLLQQRGTERFEVIGLGRK